MGCDVVMARSEATGTPASLFGCNRHGLPTDAWMLERNAGRDFALGEMVRLRQLELPQARRTATVVGFRSANSWGYGFGVNEHHVAIAEARWRSKLDKADRGLSGTDLVRLALERSATARQALDLITDLVSRHGQVGAPDSPRDSLFLIADARDSYLVEAAGRFWASLECRAIRAASDVSMIRHDWQRFCPGLAEHAIQQGCWPDDGSKLDFGRLNDEPLGADSAPRRWGRASLLLEQQNGHIDATFLRRLLGDHYEGTRFEVDPARPGDGPRSLCRHAAAGDLSRTLASFVAPLSPEPDAVPLVWSAFGPPCVSVYVPIFLDGDLPAAYQPTAHPWQAQLLTEHVLARPQSWAGLRAGLAALQLRLDQETDDVLPELRALRRQRQFEALHRQASLFMQNHAEQLEAEFYRLENLARRRPVFVQN